ncbi:MAG: xanthine dehydrogenase family protein molybdopterin-binding subunit [Candidatus Bathyarchaeia archaeon]
MAVTSMFGASVKRRDDPRLITGKAAYTDDITLPRMVYAAFLRSPYPHARIKSITTDRAKALTGVLGVFTGQDIKGVVAPIPCAWQIPNSELKLPDYNAMAIDEVRYTGDAIAVAVAKDPGTARDAVDLIDVDYEPLGMVLEQEEAVKPGASLVHNSVPNNQVFHWKVSGGDTQKAFGDAKVVVKARFTNQRLQPTALETRGAVAQYNSATGELTLWVTSQNPHVHRLLLSLVLGIPEHKLRVIAPEVGGGFGSKLPIYPGEAVVCFLAKRLGRPVKWVEDRRENYLATVHGRDHVQYVELAANRDGTILGIKANVYANMGAYVSTAGPGIPTILFGLMLCGSYKIPNVQCDVYGVFTNTTPTDTYRGAGRPEALFIIERMVDILAQELSLDPSEVRRKNFISKTSFPYTTATGLVYDSGDYVAALDKALQIVDYKKLREEQARLRKDGRLLGIGLSTYVEICGLGPSKVVRSTGFGLGLWESCTVRMHPTGKVTVFTGANPHGQGEETTFTQIVSEELGVPLDDIDIIYGDTGMIPFGMGTYGSRTTAVAGSSIALAARKISEKSKKIAAHLLEASEEDLAFEKGSFQVKGAPGKSKTIQEIAFATYTADNLPTGMEPGLEAVNFYDPENFVFPFGAHICVVEIDRETGEVKVLRYVAVDDCGRIINPLIVDGQVHGGIAQGLAQALYEEAVYDEGGQLLTGTLVDYGVPTSLELPSIDTDKTVTRAPMNPIGAKGVGETGTIGSPPAAVNAVVDALSHLGVKHIDMPLKRQKIWRILQEKTR